MHAATRPYFRTGIALAGAGAIAIAPLAVPPAQLSSFEHRVAQAVAHDVQLTADITASLDALFNSTLAGVAVSLGLDAGVVVDTEPFLTNLTAVINATVNAITEAFATNPLDGLLYLATLPINIVTGVVSGLLDGLAGVDFPGMGGAGAVVDSITGLLTAPIQFVLDTLEAGNEAFAGLLTDGIDGLSGLFTTGLSTVGGLVTGAIDAGAGLLGSIFTGAGMVLTESATAIGEALAPFAALPLIGPPIAAFGDLLGGFAAAGGTVLGGIGTAIPLGAGVITGLIDDTITAVNTAVASGAGLLDAGVGTLSQAFYEALSGVATAIGEFVPGVVPPPAPPVTFAPNNLAPLSGSATTGLQTFNLKVDGGTSGQADANVQANADAQANADVHANDVQTNVDAQGKVGSTVTTTIQNQPTPRTGGIGGLISGVLGGGNGTGTGGGATNGATNGNAGGTLRGTLRAKTKVSQNGAANGVGLGGGGTSNTGTGK